MVVEFFREVPFSGVIKGVVKEHFGMVCFLVSDCLERSVRAVSSCVSLGEPSVGGIRSAISSPT